MAHGVRQKTWPELQAEKSHQPTPSVDQILDRYVQAIGGASALRKLTSRVTEMTLVVEGGDVTAIFESYAQAPNRAVMIGQVKLGNGYEIEVSDGFNGSVGWSLNPTDGGFRELSGTELAAEKRNAEFYSQIKTRELYPKIAFIGQMKVGDHAAYCVEARPSEGDPEKWFFDAQTGLLIRSDSIS